MSSMSNPGPLMQLQPRDLEEQIVFANRVQSLKVNSLMKSIDKLQKENLSLQKKNRESNRTSHYKKIQDELGQQDVMIDILHSCIGTAKAQELMASAINTLESNERAACSSCGCEEELLVSQDGALLCRRCYSQRFWAEPPADAKKANLRECPKYPDSKEKLQKECIALETELASAKRFLKQKAPSGALPKSASLNTAAALANLLAGYVQRADQLEKENASLKNHQDQLERNVTEQEEQHRQQIQSQLPAFPTEQKNTSSAADLQSRIRLRNSEMDRMVQVLTEVRKQLAAQTGKQETLKAEIEAAQSDIKKVQEEMSKWASAETAEHVKQLEKLRQSKEQRKQQMLASREQLKEVKTRLRKSLQNIGDQRGPLEVQTRIRAQARKLHTALRDVQARGKNWDKFLLQLEIEKGVGLEDRIQELLNEYTQSAEFPGTQRLEQLKQALHRLEVHEASVSDGPANELYGRWSAAKKKMQERFKVLADPQLESLSKLETLLQSEQEALDKLVAEVRDKDAQARTQRTANIQAALEKSPLSLETTAEVNAIQQQKAAELKQMKSITAPLEESLEELRHKIKDLSKKAADADQYRQVSEMSVEVERLRKSVEKERHTARRDVVKLQAAAEHCERVMADREGEEVVPGPAELPVPGRLLLVPPGSSAEEAREAAAIEAKRQQAWEKRFLPVEEHELPAIHLAHTDTGDLPDDWQESMKLQAQLDILRAELSSIQDAKADLTGKLEAPDEIRDMEHYVDKMDAMHMDLQEVVADLNMRLQAARVLLQRQMQRSESKVGSTFCQHCPHCHLSGRPAAR